jgi:hypothetical protein
MRATWAAYLILFELTTLIILVKDKLKLQCRED